MRSSHKTPIRDYCEATLTLHAHRVPLNQFDTMKFFALSVSALVSCANAFAPSISARSTTALDARKPFISGNWKLNPQTKTEAIQLAKDIAASIGPNSPNADVALFVPYVFIEGALGAVGGKLNIGAEVRLQWPGRIVNLIATNLT
jgi:hypothetical protein